jgi:hypothetical protein
LAWFSLGWRFWCSGNLIADFETIVSMGQIFFLVGLYLFGVNFGLLFQKRLPLGFICASGFLWGALAWVLILTCQLILPLRYMPLATILLLDILFVATGVLNVRRGSYQINRAQIAWLAGCLLLSILAAWAAATFDFSYGDHDSVEQVFLARSIVLEGFIPWVAMKLTAWGIYLAAMHTFSAWLGKSYLSGLQPMFALSFMASFFYLSYRSLTGLIGRKITAISLALLTTTAFFSAYFVIFQAFYIHNNLIAAANFFIAVAACWLALREENKAWLVFAMLGLAGFSLARIESPLFAIAFLSILLSAGQFSRRVRLAAGLPYLGFMTLWYGKLILNMGQGSEIINPAMLGIMLAAMIVFAVLLIASLNPWMERFALPRLHIFMLAVLALGLALAISLQPAHMLESMQATLQNMYRYGNWEATWVVLLILLAFALIQPGLPRERIFLANIAGFFLLLFLLVFSRDPYWLSWGDSANRMITAIAPVAFLYLLLKYANGYFGGLVGNAGQAKSLTVSDRLVQRVALAAVGIVIIVQAVLLFI